jgi:hypothetical protein
VASPRLDIFLFSHSSLLLVWSPRVHSLRNPPAQESTCYRFRHSGTGEMASVKAFSARATSSLTTRRDVQAVVVPARGRAGGWKAAQAGQECGRCRSGCGQVGSASNARQPSKGLRDLLWAAGTWRRVQKSSTHVARLEMLVAILCRPSTSPPVSWSGLLQLQAWRLTSGCSHYLNHRRP